MLMHQRKDIELFIRLWTIDLAKILNIFNARFTIINDVRIMMQLDKIKHYCRFPCSVAGKISVNIFIEDIQLNISYIHYRELWVIVIIHEMSSFLSWNPAAKNCSYTVAFQSYLHSFIYKLCISRNPIIVWY